MSAQILMFLMTCGAMYSCVLSLPRNCTREDICLPVESGVCDNSKCLTVNISDINEFYVKGARKYTWNIAHSLYTNNCPMKVSYETLSSYDEPNRMEQKFILTYGKSCEESITIPNTVTTDTDSQLGQVKVTKGKRGGDVYENCYLFMEPGVAYVYRSCLIDPNYYSGLSCAAIYAIKADGNCQHDKLLNFLHGLPVDLKQLIVDCI